MSAEPALSVLFLWHQHQPFYKDPVTNRYEMPWVRLHATKDYYDMAALLDEFPKVKANFNLVPSLLAQLDDYASGEARDPFIELTLKPAETLSDADKQFLLKNFFMAHWERMIDPYPRYRELLDKRGRRSSPEDLTRTQQYFSEQDWRDLQTWFNLTWIDPLWRERDAFIRSLFDRGKGFSEDDKRRLAAFQKDVCGLVVAKHKELADRGQIEITATPFYHPILPLLCDTDEAKMAMPHMESPQRRFTQPDDARTQIQRAIEDHERRFGRRPRGMWPSEGSVSETVAGLFSELGVQWIATDEAVLALSIGERFKRDDLYQPYAFTAGGKTLHFFFRDHELSDAIGFVYATWDPEAAANDFIARLHGIRNRLMEGGGALTPHVVPVILDGENCWEYYEKDGLPFLRALYKRLSEDPLLETVTGSDYLMRHAETSGALPKLWSGSWINANFSIWIGHREDNQAWDALARTRDFLVKHLEEHPQAAQTPEARLAWEEIYIAEGSDWCWWYGDDHSSANDETFDYLFRKHLMNVYSLLGKEPPDDLRLAIKAPRAPSAALKPPIDFISPRIDGRSSYYEWRPAGSYDLQGGGTGTMHRVETIFKTHYFGFDLDYLYLRFDFTAPPTPALLADLRLRILFIEPKGVEALIDFEEAQPRISLSGPDFDPARPPTLASKAALQKILECAVPLKALAARSSSTVAHLRYQLVVERAGQPIERWPADHPIVLPYPTPEMFADAWHV